MLIWFGEDILTFCRNRIQSGCKSYVQLCDIPGYHANIFFISYIEIRLFSKYPGLRCPEHLMISGILLVKKLMIDFLSSEYYSKCYFLFRFFKGISKIPPEELCTFSLPSRRHLVLQNRGRSSWFQNWHQLKQDILYIILYSLMIIWYWPG